MDKKIPQKDKSSFTDIVFDRSKPFRDNIVNFARIFRYPMSSNNSLTFNKDDERCNMIAYKLSPGIEIGYFYFNLKTSVRIIGLPSLKKKRVILSFIFGTDETHITRIENSPKKGVSNSIFIHGTQIKTINSIERGTDFYLLKISYKKKILRKLFGIPDYLMNEILNDEKPEIHYVQLDTKIITALELMELKSIPQETKIPYLLGKSYELMALVLDVIENRSKDHTFKFTAIEIEKLLRVRGFILGDWKNPPTTQRVGKFLGMSPTKAKVMFKQFYGKPIYKYFNERRLEEAMKIILAREHTIAEISRVLGFKNPSHFSESFKKKYNVLPKRLSKSIK